jgi:hypothetical protein
VACFTREAGLPSVIYRNLVIWAETYMLPLRSNGHIISATDARQGATGHNVYVVLFVSLLLAAIAGAGLVGYFWMYSPPIGG